MKRPWGDCMIGVALFGSTVVTVDGVVIPAASLGGRPRQILEILAVHAGTPVGKDRLGDLLWDGEPPASFVGTLESYVCVLRRKLRLDGGRRSVLTTTPNGYLLDANAVSIDLLDFRRLATAVSTASTVDAVASLTGALGLVRGELLADDPYAAWAIRARELFTRELVVACVRGAQLANSIGDFDQAVHLARRAVDDDRLCEDGWQHLMRSFWLSGRRPEALRAYAELRNAVLDELGDEPSEATQELYLAILRDAPVAQQRATRDVAEMKTLLVLLRQVLEDLPGVQAPAMDSALAAVAVRAIAMAG